MSAHPGLRAPFLALALVLASALPALGQAGGGLGSQTLGRSYWFLFLAYAIAWALVLGWVVSIARRLARVEKELEDPRET
jgi:CcmD family protein